MFVFGVRHTLSPFGRYQLAMRDDVRYVNHVSEQRKFEPTPGAGQRTHISIHQIQSVCLGCTFVVGNIGQRDASDCQPSDRHRQSQPVQLLVSIIILYEIAGAIT